MRRPALSQLSQLIQLSEFGQLDKLLPDTIELWYVALATVILALLGTGNVLLEKMQLISTSDLIGQQISTRVTHVFEFLSSLSFSANAASMLVWGGAGLIIYSTLQSVIRLLRTVQYDKEIDMTYSHPLEYTRQNFVRQMVIDTFLGSALLMLLALSLVLYFAFLMPNSIAYLQHFIVGPSVSSILDPVYGLAVAFLGTMIVYIALKMVIHRHRLASYTEQLEPPIE